MDKLYKLTGDLSGIKKESQNINNDYERKLISMDKELNSEVDKLKKIEDKLTRLETKPNDKTPEKILAVTKARIIKQKNIIKNFKEKSERETRVILELIEINNGLGFIEKAEIDYTYHGKMLGLLETYRKQWEKERGLLRKRKIELSPKLEH